MEVSFKKPNKNHSRPFFRYNNFSVMDSSNEKFPDLVEIVRGPSWARRYFGKKYVNIESAIKSVDLICAERMIAKQSINECEAIENILF